MWYKIYICCILGVLRWILIQYRTHYLYWNIASLTRWYVITLQFVLHSIRSNRWKCFQRHGHSYVRYSTLIWVTVLVAKEGQEIQMCLDKSIFEHLLSQDEKLSLRGALMSVKELNDLFCLIIFKHLLSSFYLSFSCWLSEGVWCINMLFQIINKYLNTYSL